MSPTDKMAFSKDSAGQSPLPTDPFLLPVASIPDSHLNLPICAHETLDSVQTTTPPQEKDTPLQYTVFPNQADKARAHLKDYLTGQYLRFPDKPREYILPVSSFYQLVEDPDFESDRKQYALLVWSLPNQILTSPAGLGSKSHMTPARQSSLSSQCLARDTVVSSNGSVISPIRN